MTTGIPLRVLLVEDSEDDASLIVFRLEDGGYAVTSHRVETAEAMQLALESQAWDAIISDYNLPFFNGLDALKLLQHSGLDIVFILVSGAIGEEIAVEVMKAGAHDYLLKDKLIRLVPTLERELRKAKERDWLRRAEESQRNLEQQLAQALEQAELANKRKSQVLAFVAHEFKNPLGAMLSFAEMLETGMAGDLNDKQRKYARNIITGGNHLKDLISDILDIATIEAGRIELVPEFVSVALVISEVRTVIEPMASQKQLALDVTLADGLDVIWTDRKRMRQIFINLLSNAIKYTPMGGRVTLQGTRHPMQQEVVFDVIDNGIGIPETELANLFHEFYRVNDGFASREEGLGLGLALSKRLVELQGGTLTVESVQGKGSTFSVHLPDKKLTGIA